MKEFIFKACSDDGTIMEDSLRAPSRQEAAEEIFSRNLHLIHLEEKRSPLPFPSGAAPSAPGRSSPFLPRNGLPFWMQD